jgi:hypothetical protein
MENISLNKIKHSTYFQKCKMPIFVKIDFTGRTDTIDVQYSVTNNSLPRNNNAVRANRL